MNDQLNLCGVCSQAPDQVLCLCQTPGLPLCSGCILPHLTTTATHIIRTKSEATPTNEGCSLCNRVKAGTICCCVSTGVMLCAACLLVHLENGFGHYQIPIQYKRNLTHPDYIVKLRTREKTISEGLKELEDNLTVISECEQALLTRTEAAIQNIVQYRNTTLTKLIAIKEEVKNMLKMAKKEVNEHIYEDRYEPRDTVAVALWGYQEGCLRLFSYTTDGEYQVTITQSETKNPNLIESDTEQNAEIEESVEIEGNEEVEEEIADSEELEVNSENDKLAEKSDEEVDESDEKDDSEESDRTKSAPGLYVVTSTHLNTYSSFNECYSHETALSRTIQVSTSSVYCLIDPDLIWVSGGNDPCTRLVFEIKIETGEVRNRKGMMMARWGHGMLQYNKNCVYVFGGANKHPLKDCERYVPALKKWEKCAKMMNARYYFTPCLHANNVYLFGGKGTANLEVFYIGTGQFEELPIKLHAAKPTAAVVIGGEIVIFQKKRRYYWDIDAKTCIWVAGEDVNEECWSCACAVYWNSCVYIPRDEILVFSAISLC